jgi:hypothetical protein
MNQSPEITDISWAHIEIDINGEKKSFKDVKLFPGGAKEWDWSETGTEHSPGVQLSDVEELIENGAEVIILSSGMSNALGVCDETIQMLKDKNIPHHVLQTEEAVKKYNELRENENVGGLFHTTC